MPCDSKHSSHYLLTETGAKYPMRNPTYMFLMRRISYGSKPQGLASTMFALIARQLSFNTCGLGPVNSTKQTANVVPFFRHSIFTWRATTALIPKFGAGRVIWNSGVKMCGSCLSIDHARLAIGYLP